MHGLRQFDIPLSITPSSTNLIAVEPFSSSHPALARHRVRARTVGSPGRVRIPRHMYRYSMQLNGYSFSARTQQISLMTRFTGAVEKDRKVDMKATSGLAMIAASCGVVVAAGVFGTSLEPDGSSGPDSEMDTGVTVTPTLPGAQPDVPEAAPEITGPAALPPEEQGLPGN
jgi:hypothetical protein